MQQPQVINAGWIRLRCGAYLRGKGLSWGCGNDPIFPQKAQDGGKYSLSIDVLKAQHVDILDINLDFIRPNTMDHLFIGARDGAPLEPLLSKLKIDAHVAIHTVGDHSERVRAELLKYGAWQEKDTYFRDGQFLGIWKLVGRQKKFMLPPKPRAAKRACIARFGAIGDMIMISPLIRKLHEDGYVVTMNVTPYCAEVLRHNPYVSNIIIQERDVIPNQDLGAYWNEWKNEYDKYINLSESIEGKLLRVEGRRDFYTTKSWRHATCDVNYYDQTMRLGGYPELTGQRGEIYFSSAEQRDAKHLRQKFADKFLTIWSLKGSSFHKQYPLLPPTLGQWLDAHPDAVVALVGAPNDQHLVFEHPQVVSLLGKTDIRTVFAMTSVANLVVGPESAVINAAACFDTAKIVLLSHSTHENLCKYWTNHECLAPENVPCYPCHQLHYNNETCPQTQIFDTQKPGSGPLWEGPACAAMGVHPARLQASLTRVYDTWASTRPTTI